MHRSGEAAPRKSPQCPAEETFRALMQFFAPFTGTRTVCPSKKTCKNLAFELKYKKPPVSVVENPSQVRAKGST